jgi:hypothetical protein
MRFMGNKINREVKYLSYMFGESALILITNERVWNNKNKRK